MDYKLTIQKENPKIHLVEFLSLFYFFFCGYTIMDNLVFEESVTTETDQSEFIEKKYVYVNDNNAQNYSSQVVIDSTPLSNAGGYVNFSE